MEDRYGYRYRPLCNIVAQATFEDLRQITLASAGRDVSGASICGEIQDRVIETNREALRVPVLV
jgi:hypothetical protein